MRDLFDSELTAVGNKLAVMANLVGDAVALATTALLECDISRADRVISGDARIDTLQREIDDSCLDLLALQSPVATDLRIVVTALRLGATLERMGDLARHIAQQARMRYPQCSVPEQLHPTFAEMGMIACRLAGDASRLIETRNLELAERVPLEDDRMDELHRNVFKTMLASDWTHDARTTVDTTLLSRFYERFGDHAVSVSERIHFLVTGHLAAAAASKIGVPF